jgi:hypothetical protein
MNRLRSIVWFWLGTMLSVTLTGCTSFASVRPTRVMPGPKLAAQASVSTPPGDLTSWFFSYDCAEDCNRPIGAAELTLLYGWQRLGQTAVELGVGYLFPVDPFIEGYAQFNVGTRPVGIGGRIGIPLRGWTEHRLYLRTDIGRMVVSPSFYLHTGETPNGQSRGTVAALVQSFGWPRSNQYMVMIPTLSLGVARVSRTRYEEQMRTTSVFAVAAFNVLLHKGTIQR